MNHNGPRSKWSYCVWLWDLLLVGVLTWTGFGIRSANLDESLWIDELHTAWTVLGPEDEIASRARQGNQPLLYFMLVDAVMPNSADQLNNQSVGSLETRLRSVSLTAGLLLLPAIYLVALILSRSRVVASLAMFLAVLDPDLAFFAQEARSYSLLQLLALIHFFLLSLVLFQRRLRRGMTEGGKSSEQVSSQVNPSWFEATWVRVSLGVLFGLTLVIGVWVHYITLLWLVADGGLLLLKTAVESQRSDRQHSDHYRPLASKEIWLPLAIGMGIFFLGSIPLFGSLLSVGAKQADWSSIVRVWPLPQQLAFAISLYGTPIMISLIILAVRYWLGKNNRIAQGASDRSELASYRSRLLRVLVVWSILPIGVAGLLAAFDLSYVFLPRYLSMFWPVMVLAASLLPSLFQSWKRKLVIAIGLAFFASVQSPFFARDGHFQLQPLVRNERWRGLFDQLEQNRLKLQQSSTDSAGEAEDKELVYFFPNLVEDSRISRDADEAFLRYVQFAFDSAYPIDRDVWRVVPKPVQAASHFDSQDVEQIIAKGRFWIVYRGQIETLERILDELGRELNLRNQSFDALVDMHGFAIAVEINIKPWNE